MNALADLLGFVITHLQNADFVQKVFVLETSQFSENRFTIKVRAELKSGDVLQIRLYRNDQHTDYAYQLLHDESHMLRWDNKEHFPALASFPHHFHNAHEDTESSPLSGDPTHDLPIVLNLIANL